MRMVVFFVATSLGLPALAQNLSAGQALYTAACSFCHGTPPRGGPDRLPLNTTLIRAAIATVPAMVSFQAVNFTDTQLNDLSAYVRALNLPPPGPKVPTRNYGDLWWNPSESGWGMNLVQHASNNIFGVIYTYEPPNRPMWFVMAGGAWTSATTFTGSLYRVTGAPPSITFRGGDVVKVGDMVLLFGDDGNTATVDYRVDGNHVTRQIARQPF
jgi:hypothetical protein